MSQDVYALLAQANLSRIRGQWQEAIDKCMAAMRIVPGNGAAQSLLGDIYENQGRIEEAVRWYRLALDTNPNSPADRQKLDRLLAVRNRTNEGQHDETVAAPVDASLPAGTLARSNFLRATAMVCGLCLFGFVLASVFQSHGPGSSGARSAASVRSQSASPVVIGQPGGGDEGSTAPIPRDPFEVGLSNALAADGSLADLRFADVIADPRNGRLTLTYVLRPVGTVDRDTVLHDALRAAETAAKASETNSYPYLTIRILLSSDDLVTSPDNGSLIFIGDIGRTELVNFPVDVSPVPSSQIQTAFTNQWWAPSLSAPPSPPSTSTPASAQPSQPSTVAPSNPAPSWSGNTSQPG